MFPNTTENSIKSSTGNDTFFYLQVSEMSIMYSAIYRQSVQVVTCQGNSEGNALTRFSDGIVCLYKYEIISKNLKATLLVCCRLQKHVMTEFLYGDSENQTMKISESRLEPKSKFDPVCAIIVG